MMKVTDKQETIIGLQLIHIITKFIKYLINNWECLVILFLVVIILKGYLFPIASGKPSSETILIPSDSLNKSVVERDTRLQILLNSIQLHRGFGVQQDLASESLKMQGRLLFITLFSALITVLYSSKKYEEQYGVIAFTALLVGFIWYGINVHKLDIENRGLITTEMVYNTELKLLKIQPEDNRLYYLDYKKLGDAVNNDTLDHKIDKIKRFISPDLSDTVFNMIPLLIFAFLYRKLKKNPKSIASQAD